MSRAKAEEIARRLWSVDGEAIEILSGGLTNENYKVTAPDGKSYVCRIFGEKTDLLKVNRDAECYATSYAASIGIGPAVLFDLRDEGALVLEFVAGEALTPELLTAPRMLRWVTDSLRQFHTSGLTLPAEMNPFRMTEYYYQTACEYGIRAREEEVFGWAHSVAERIEEAVAFEITSPCHTDLTAVNILDDGGGGIRLLDWEYSSMSDPRFDLADLSANQGFTADDDRRLVLFYYGAVNERSVAEIRLLRFMSLFKNLTWSYVQSRIAGTDREADNGTSGRGYDQEKGGLSCAQRAREELAADGDELRGLSHSEDGSEGGGLDLRAVGIADFDFDSFAEGYLRRMQTITEDPEFERWLSIMVSGAS